MKTIKLTKGYEAIVDDVDFDVLGNFSWQCEDTANKHVNYAKRTVYENGGKRNVYLHREIMKPLSGQQVDHINGDGLDNRRQNLRCVSRSENQRNAYAHRSGRLAGVYPRKKKEGITRFYARIRNTHLGVYDTAEAAHQEVLQFLEDKKDV